MVLPKAAIKHHSFFSLAAEKLVKEQIYINTMEGEKEGDAKEKIIMKTKVI